MTPQLAFISYRRDDEGPSARFIKAELERYFGPSQVFMDVENVRIADNWVNIINENLNKATVLIAVIGRNWLKIHDEYFRRRIDNENDWVRNEIEFALNKNIIIVPFLIGCPMPVAESLPVSIKNLVNYQALSLSASNWRNDMANIVTLLKNNRFAETRGVLDFPVPIKGMLFPLPLTINQINEALKEYKGWKIVDYISREKKPQPGIGIEKIFKFKSFEKAIEFISIVSKHVSEIQHHPEWENVWKSVRVRLATWDLGHKVSNLDISLAEHMEKQFSEMQ